MEALFPLIALLVITLVAGGVFFMYFTLGQNDKRTKWYSVALLLTGLASGLMIHFVNQHDKSRLANSYSWGQIWVLLVGFFHVWFMYRRLFWSKRHEFESGKDSFLPEWVFTVFVGCLLSVGAVVGLFALKNPFYAHFWLMGLPFLTPFLLLKTLDLLNQIPVRDFDPKWIFTKQAIQEENWDWVNEIWVEFEVYENWVSQRRKKGRVAHFRVLVPRQVPLREVYRLAVREYNRKSPEIVVQDLGFEPVNSGRFWWLFSVKFRWLKPFTWFRDPRFLDPMRSVVANDLRPRDVIRAQRMAFQSDNVDDDDVPMGEL